MVSWLLIVIAMGFILYAAVVNFMYVFAALRAIPYVRRGKTISYLFDLSMMQIDAAGRHVDPAHSDMHEHTKVRFRQGIRSTIIAFAVTLVVIVLDTFIELLR